MLTNEQKEVVRGIASYNGNELTLEEVKELILEVSKEASLQDEYIDCSFGEYRIIHSDEIWDIYYEETIELIKDCYFSHLNDIPSFIVIDWDATVEGCFIDGYGHHFSSYDGYENEYGSYYIFRVN